jgi:hypothetical protein
MDGKTMQQLQQQPSMSLEFLIQQYLLVSRCWENSELAISNSMSVERAIAILRDIDIRTGTIHRSNGLRLRRKANILLLQIVGLQVEPTDSTEVGTEVEIEIEAETL